LIVKEYQIRQIAEKELRLIDIGLHYVDIGITLILINHQFSKVRLVRGLKAIYVIFYMNNPNILF
jgi:hypothetical protein